ncbi:MAG: hypothetical protein SPG48_11435 [Treponema sp.]|nr:hypothetical protein [Treponema sp.]
MNITFLFGAGAEGKGNFGLPSGLSFLKTVFFDDEIKSKVLDVLEEKFSRKAYFGDPSVKWRRDTFDAKEVLLKAYLVEKSKKDKVFFKNYSYILKGIVSKTALDDLETLHTENNEKSSSECREKIDSFKGEFYKIIKQEIENYTDIKNDINKNLFKCISDNDNGIDIDYSLGLPSFLDQYFHTIANPKKYSVIKFNKIFNFYWICYFSILDSVVKSIPQDILEKDQFLNKLVDSSGNIDYGHIMENIKDVTKALYDLNLENINDKCYYSIIKEKIKKGDKVNVVTTNYYKYSELLLASENESVIHLNGKLPLFEIPESLEVIDVRDTELPEDKLFFPFIFGQSMVKPLVDPVQVEEFSKFGKVLNSTDVLCVLGYNLNEDDNHINEYLHKYVKNNKNLLVVISETDEQNVHEKIKCSQENIKYCCVRYGNNESVVDEIFNEIENINR